MKGRYSIALSLLATVMLISSLVLRFIMPNSPAEAASSMLKWSTIDKPSSYGDRADIVLRSEMNNIAVGPRGQILLYR